MALPKDPAESDAVPDAAALQLRDLTATQRNRLLHKLGRRSLSGAALVAEGLHQSGIRRLCGIGGTPVDAIFAEAARRGIRVMAPRHQNTATLMAASANYLSGTLENAVLVSAGPAVTNTITGILVARDNHWPLLVLGGRRALRGEGSGYFQELDAVPVMRPITRWAATVQRAADVMPTIHEAVERALSGIPGPVYLDLPEDVLADSAVPAELEQPVREPPPAPDPALVDRALHLLRASRTPLLCLGEELRWGLDSAALRRLVEREQLPFISTSLARGLLPDDHPLCYNAVRHRVPAHCDLVIMAGAWFDWRYRLGVEFPPDVSVIHACAEEASIGRNVRPTLAVPGDAAAFLNALSHASERAGVANRRARTPALDAVREAEIAHQAAQRSKREAPMLPQQLYDVLLETLPDDAFVILDGSIHLAWGQHLLRVNRPLSWLDATWSGCIGVGIPFGFAARLVFPDRPVVVVSGDMGFGLSGMDLETAVRNDLPFLLIIVNNDGVNGRVRQRSVMTGADDNPFYVFAPELRYDEVACGLGVGRTAWIQSADALRRSVAEALESGGLTCLNVQVNPDAPVPPVW